MILKNEIQGIACFTFRSRLAPRNAGTCLRNGAAACLADFIAAFIAFIALGIVEIERTKELAKDLVSQA